MTWLSRLLPQSPSLQRVANRNNRTRQAQRRRRMSTLETLEGRTLLSNVVTSIFAGTLAPLPALPAGAHGLEITTDTHNDTFTVTENANGTVTLLGNSKTQINSLPIGTPFTTSTSLPISAIYFNIAAGTSVNTNSITLTGHGTVQNVLFYEPGYSATLPAPALYLNVTGVTNTSGTLTVDDGTPGTYVGGILGGTTSTPTTLTPATVSSSQFKALSITQVGCCQAEVALNNDTVPGTVSVTEGTANNDLVTATGDDFGATTISQYVGLNPNGQNGANDLVSVDDSRVQILSLAVTQNGSGDNQKILIGAVGSDVEIALTGFITASQPNTVSYGGSQGSNDLIQIISITTVGTSNNPHLVPDSITTLQGNGNDTTTVDNAQVYGNISVTQGTGNDIVNIAADTVGFTSLPLYGNLTVSQGSGTDSVIMNSNGLEGAGPNTFYGYVSITQGGGGSDVAVVEEATVSGYVYVSQGSGGGDSATVDNDTVGGNIFVLQLNGGGDIVHIAAVTAGTSTTVGPVITDLYGLLYISQGNGGGDLVVVDSNGSEGTGPNSFNNVVIEQGNGGGPLNLASCSAAPGYDDVVVFEEATVTSDLFIVQNATFTPLVTSADLTTAVVTISAPAPTGDPSLEGTGAGNDLVEIGGNYEGVNYPGITPVVPAQVIVGGQTYVFQGGANNEVDLGGAMDPSGIDFQTYNLDIWTGNGGGGFVTAQNTVVTVGSFYGYDWVINGGADGNTYLDLGGNSIAGVPSTLPYGPGYSG